MYLTPLEVELRRNPSAGDWRLTLDMTVMRDNLHLELCKHIITQNSLQPYGLNENLKLFNKQNWITFVEWAKDRQ